MPDGTQPQVQGVYAQMQLGYEWQQHDIGNRTCLQEWCDGGGRWPKPCHCGGLVHATFGDENSDCDYWLYKACDKCGEDYDCDEEA